MLPTHIYEENRKWTEKNTTISFQDDRVRNKLTRHMNQAGGIKPELQLRGTNNRIDRKDRFPFVSNTNDTKLILKAKKLLPFYLIRWLTRASSLRIRRTLVEMALFITNYGMSVCAGEGSMPQKNVRQQWFLRTFRWKIKIHCIRVCFNFGVCSRVCAISIIRKNISEGRSNRSFWNSHFYLYS